MAREKCDDWMAIHEHVTIQAKIIEKDICEAIASTCKAIQPEACEINRHVYAEILPVRTIKDIC